MLINVIGVCVSYGAEELLSPVASKPAEEGRVSQDTSYISDAFHHDGFSLSLNHHVTGFYVTKGHDYYLGSFSLHLHLPFIASSSL